MSKKLMVAGCSFMAPSTNPNLASTDFGSVLAKNLGWQLQNMARQGCSNGGIRIQIDEIIRQRPDFAIVGPTFPNRMELPAQAAPFDFSTPHVGRGAEIEQHLLNPDVKYGYDVTAGLDNINYGNNDYRMICETIFSLAENYQHHYRSNVLDKDTHMAIKYYVNHIYDANWKCQQDRWIISDGIVKMHEAGVRFLVVTHNLWLDPAKADADIPRSVPRQYLVTDYNLSPVALTTQYPFTGPDPGYHGSPQSQIKLAEIYQNLMSDRFGIS